MAKLPCPCCKFLTLSHRGDYEICKVCFWEDDGQNDSNADAVVGGPNYALSLRAAQENFKRWGAVEERFIPHVRPPLSDELPN